MRLLSRLEKLESRLPQRQADSDSVEHLFERLEQRYARILPDGITEQTLARGAAIDVLSAGYCTYAPLPDYVDSRLKKFAEADDALGAVSRLILAHRQ